MGYIEELAAREAARQEIGRAKQAEAARVLDQGQVGLARVMADPYAGGLSQEDAYKLQLVQKAREANAKAAYDKLAADRFNASKQYISAKQAIDNTPIQYRREENPDEGGYTFSEYKNLNPADLAVVRKYQQNIDPGLAAKWMSSYKGR